MINRIAEIIDSGKTFLITAHVRLDGDALGSELALWHVLRNMGKDPVIYNQDKTPDVYVFLPGSDVIVHSLDSIDAFDAVFVLDCGELERIGSEAEKVGSIKNIINMDHHISNNFFTDISLVDCDASSTGEILFQLIENLDTTITKDIASNLYAAILTDTGAFRYSNTGSHTFEVASKLVTAGADPRWIAENVYETKPLGQIRLMEEALKTLELHAQNRVGLIVVSERMLHDAEALPEHTEGCVDLIRSIKGVHVAVFLQEASEGNYKVSLRSKGKINVSAIAELFGGGGHLNAAACRVEGDVAVVKKKLLRAIEDGWA